MAYIDHDGKLHYKKTFHHDYHVVDRLYTYSFDYKKVLKCVLSYIFCYLHHLTYAHFIF